MPSAGRPALLRGNLHRDPALVTASLSGVGEAGEASRGLLGVALATLRPRQWMKNALLVAPAGAAGALDDGLVSVRVALAVVAFCLICGGIYALNDVRDRREDALHPRKRHRPVAAGLITPRTAVILGCSAMATGLSLSVAIRPLLGLVALGYVALTLSYTLFWRQVVVLDLFAIAGGFVLRAVAGGVAAPVPLSRWFLLVVSAAAVMMAAGKRLAEWRRTHSEAAPRRRVLERYSERVLLLILAASGAVALLAYCMWAFALPIVHGVPWRVLTVAPFAACLVRYRGLVRVGAGETPEDLVLGDRLLALGVVAWVILFGLSVNAAS